MIDNYKHLFETLNKPFFWAVLLFTCLLMPVHGQEFICNVKSVHDGDTFTCKDKKKIRVWGIDTPEVSPAVKREIGLKNGGYDARNYLSSIILNKPLVCGKKSKSYKRVVAQCFYNGEDIARIMLKSGYARELTKFSHGYYSEGLK